LQEVTQKAQAAEIVKASVQKVKDKAQKLVDEINSEKMVAEAKLEAAKPALQEAESALQVNYKINYLQKSPCSFIASFQILCF
jgi:dynein heavy chain